MLFIPLYLSGLNDEALKTTTMNEYIQKIIATGIANGLTAEQLMSNPQAAAKAYLESQLSAIEKAGSDILKSK